MASSQGSLEILKYMFEKQENLFLEVLYTTDFNDQTPLHKAAMFGHIEVADFLLKKGCFIDSLDNKNRTPLLIAASRSNIEMVQFLIKSEANIHSRDSEQRNFLQLILLAQIAESLGNIEIKKVNYNSYSVFNGILSIFEILKNVFIISRFLVFMQKLYHSSLEKEEEA